MGRREQEQGSYTSKKTHIGYCELTSLIKDGSGLLGGLPN